MSHAAVGPEERQRSVEHRYFEVFAHAIGASFSGEKCGGNRLRCRERGGLIDDDRAVHIVERHVRVELDRTVAAHRLDHGIKNWHIRHGARLAETRHPHRDEFGVDLPQFLMGDA